MRFICLTTTRNFFATIFIHSYDMIFNKATSIILTKLISYKMHKAGGING